MSDFKGRPAPTALHLTFLTVNRVVFANEGRETGWHVDASPEAAVLVLAYLVITAGVFLLLARLRGRRIVWNEREPE